MRYQPGVKSYLPTHNRIVRIGASGAMRFFNLLQPGPSRPASLHCLSAVVEACITSQALCCTHGSMLHTWYKMLTISVTQCHVSHRSKQDMMAADGLVCIPLFLDTRMRVLQQALAATRDLPPERHAQAAHTWTMLYNSLIKEHECLGALVVTSHDPLLFSGRYALGILTVLLLPDLLILLHNHSSGLWVTCALWPACWH